MFVPYSKVHHSPCNQTEDSQAIYDSIYVLESPMLDATSGFERSKEDFDLPSYAIVLYYVTNLLFCFDWQCCHK